MINVRHSTKYRLAFVLALLALTSWVGLARYSSVGPATANLLKKLEFSGPTSGQPAPDRGPRAGAVTTGERLQDQDGSGQQIPGVPGIATESAVVNIADLLKQEEIGPPPAGPGVVHPYMPVPDDLPAPPGVEVINGTPTEAGGPAGPSGSPPPSSSFQALDDNNAVIPPDTHGAAGPNHLMVTLNTQVRYQNRAGAVLGTLTLNAFWQSVGNPSAFDPKVLYDPYNDRWMFTAVANARQASSSVLIGVSRTNDPTGVWNLYRVDADPTDLVWADYPSIGFNRDWIVVQLNMYHISDNNFDRSHIYAFNKANLYAGGTATFTLFSRSDIGATQVPAITHDNTLATLYLLQNWNSANGQLRRYTITGPVGSEVLTLGALIASGSSWSATPAGGLDFAPQLGSTRRIQNNDARMQNLVYRDGRLWCAHTIFLPPGSTPDHSAVQWWSLSAAGVIQQRARIEDPSGFTFYAFPTIAVNSTNDALIGFSRFAAGQYAGANYAFRAETDPVNTLRSDFVLKAGEAPYYKIFGGTRNRWGDYSSTVVDPVNDSDLWTIQEYAATPVGGFDRWGTWWGRIVPPNFSINATPPSQTVRPGESTTYTVTVTGTTGFSGTVTLTASGLPAGAGASFDPPSVTGSGTSTMTVTTSDGTTTAGTYPITITGTSGSRRPTASVSLVVTDFALGAVPPSQTITPGGSTAYTVTVTALNGFGGTVTFSASNLPEGASASFDPPSVTGSGTSTMTVTTSLSVAGGTYPLTITGTSGSLQRTASVSLVVADYTLAADPKSQTVAPGESTHYTVTVTSIKGFAGDVVLSASGLPKGASASFDPPVVTGSGSADVTVTTSDTTPPDTYTLTFTGTSGLLERTTSVTLVVKGS